MTSGACEDFHRASAVSRRSLLAGLGITAGGSVLSTVFGDAMRQAVFADGASDRILVVLSLRGGMDGLGMVVPHGDPAYFAARPRLALPTESLIGADAQFGLHPQFKPLEWLWNAGEMAAVHAAGMAQPNRSHFAAMELIEDADPASSLRQGWVNRMVGLNVLSDPLEAVQVNSAATPALLAGPSPSLASNQLDGLQLAGLDQPGDWGARRRRQLALQWSGSEAIDKAGLQAVNVSDTLRVLQHQAAPGTAYPTSPESSGISAALKDTARLIRANVGTQVVAIDYGSWDMHSNYGTVQKGRMQSMVRGLALSLDAFMRDLGDRRSSVTVVTTSEFGRRVTENGNSGLDHGWGNVMLVLGGGVRGGKYYGTWPGLAAGKLVDGDLQVTTDYRDVFAEVVAASFPDRPLSKVFPGLSHRPLGLMPPI